MAASLTGKILGLNQHPITEQKYARRRPRLLVDVCGRGDLDGLLYFFEGFNNAGKMLFNLVKSTNT